VTEGKSRSKSVEPASPTEGEESPGPSVDVSDDGDDVVDGEIVDIVADLNASGTQFVKKGELAHVIQRVSVSTHHRGPLPRPEDLAAYSSLIENGAERIMRMAEKEQDHRHVLDNREQSLIEKTQNDDASITKRGQLFGLIIVGLIIVVAVVLAFGGHERLAALLVALDLASLAAVFVAGRWLPGRSTSVTASELGADESPPALPKADPGSNDEPPSEGSRAV